MTTLISTCSTKKEFTDRVRAGVNISMFDPSLNSQRGRVVTLRDIQDSTGYSFTVTNKLRKWFAEVTVKDGRKLVVR